MYFQNGRRSGEEQSMSGSMGTRFAKTFALEYLQNSHVCHFSGSRVKSQRVAKSAPPFSEWDYQMAPEEGLQSDKIRLGAARVAQVLMACF